MKECFRCEKVKDLAEFYTHPQMADGHLNKCKTCTKEDARRHRAANLDRIRAYDRNRADTPARVVARKCVAAVRRGDPEKRAADLESRRKWRERNKIKRATHILCGNAIRDGRLKREPCVRCGATENLHAHHEDYYKPLDVTWLCQKCHGLRHRGINDEKRSA